MYRQSSLRLLQDRLLSQSSLTHPVPIPDRPSPSNGPAQLAKRPVSKANLFGEALSDSDGSVSMPMDTRDAENALLPPAKYDRFTPTLVLHDQWFPGYRDPFPRSHIQPHPWSTRRFGLTGVSELDVDILSKHLTRPKKNIFSIITATSYKTAPTEAKWISRLGTSAQVSAL